MSLNTFCVSICECVCFTYELGHYIAGESESEPHSDTIRVLNFLLLHAKNILKDFFSPVASGAILLFLPDPGLP